MKRLQCAHLSENNLAILAFVFRQVPHGSQCLGDCGTDSPVNGETEITKQLEEAGDVPALHGIGFPGWLFE